MTRGGIARDDFAHGHVTTQYQYAMCLYHVDLNAGDMIPRPFGGIVHGARPREMKHFDFIHSRGPLKGDGLDEAAEIIFHLRTHQ